MSDQRATKSQKLRASHKPRTLQSRLRRALKVQDRFVRNLVRNCPDLLPDYRQVMEAHNAVIEAVLGELNKERASPVS